MADTRTVQGLIHMTTPAAHSLLELALAVSQKYPVFALGASKQPVVEGGFKAATQDPEAIRAQFTLPGAKLIGVPTGAASGLFVLDVDPDGVEWFNANRARFPLTRLQRTRRGGYHVVMQMPAADVRCSASKVAPGVDVRANGGYVVWWRAEGYDVEAHEHHAPVPPWLLETLRRPGDVPSSGAEPVSTDLERVRPRCNLTLEQSANLLRRLEADSYDQWVMVGQALQHEHGDDGLALWRTWSESSDKYPGDDEAASKWASFGRYSGAPVTMRAVINAAKRNGAQPSEWTGKAPVAAAPAGSATQPAKERRRFNIERGADYLEKTPPGWLVKDIVPRADLGLVYAESGAGKTFWVTDLALHMAAGKAYRDKAVKRQRVLYVCAEGAAGFSVRLRVMAKHLGIDMRAVVFDVLADVPSFLDPDQVRAIIDAAQSQPDPYDLAVVDTLAQVTAGGDENSAEDMGLAITHCRVLREQLGAMVVLVHHAGKDASKGARGWSGLRAAVDFEVAITRNDAVRSAKLSKQKDGSDGDELYFTLVPQAAGVVDEDGVEASSCYVRHDEPPAAQVRAARSEVKGENNLIVWGVVVELQALGTRTEIPYGELRAAARAALPQTGAEDRRLETADRAVTWLVAHGKLEMVGADGDRKVRVLA